MTELIWSVTPPRVPGWYWYTYRMMRPRAGTRWSLPRLTKIGKSYFTGWGAEKFQKPKESTRWIGPMPEPARMEGYMNLGGGI